MGMALSARLYKGDNREELTARVKQDKETLAATRPTAVNLFWALDRMENRLDELLDSPVAEIRDGLLQEALALWEEDRTVCRRMGKFGAELLPDSGRVLTHCNAGGLATADYGTALGVIYAAVEMGKKIQVYADETRPLLQGSRLTAWELKKSGVPVTLLCDSAAGTLFQKKAIDCVVVGADRIAGNGDAANKIGTYPLSVLAKTHDVPFYIAAPVSTFDFSIDSGDHILIEERNGDEVIHGFGKQTGPDSIAVYNPAFDVTPAENITAFITEKGVIRPPFEETLSSLMDV
jgi:methylthioribose-1-phosphate isomerase